ncbi:MAG: hypothetical protein Q8T08_08755 [Ignavibacteria bacterium]|nr:hypothetical protein [Ignavibacteria bacterium]
MRICKKCNITYDDDKKFCKKCGSPLTTENRIESKEDAKKLVFEERLKADPLNIALLRDYAQFLFNNSMLKAAVPIALKILAIDENDSLIKEMLFIAYFKLEMFEKASETGEELCKEKLNDIPFLERLAKSNEKSGKLQRSLEIYNSILDLQPENTTALYNKALAFLEESQLEEAIQIFGKLKTDGNKERIVTIYAGIEKVIKEEYDAAIEMLMPVLSEKGISTKDLDNNRGLLFLTFSLAQKNFTFEKINNWFSLIDFQVMKDDVNNLDEEILAKTLSLLVNNKLNDLQAKGERYEIQELIFNYIKKTDNYFVGSAKEINAETWCNVALKQSELGFLEDAKSSIIESTRLMPGVKKYDDELAKIIGLIKNANQRKKRKATIVWISIITLILIIAFISVFAYDNYQENKNWEMAKTKNDLSLVYDYFSKYPHGRHYDEAKVLYENLMWNYTKSINSEVSFNDYVILYPNGKYTEEALNLKEKAVWDQALKTNSVSDYSHYITLYPKGKYTSEALKFKEKAVWDNATLMNTMEDYSFYLSLYPKGKFAGLAKEKVIEFETNKIFLVSGTNTIDEKKSSIEAKNMQEDVDWDLAKSKNTIEAFEGYLNNHSGGKYSSEAKDKKEDLYWLQKTRENTQLGYLDYLSSYPQGKYTNIAKSKIVSNVFYVNKYDKVFLRAYNIDDVAECFINDKKVFQVKWGDGVVGHAAGKTDWIDVSMHINKPENLINFKGINNSGCCDFSYGFQIKINDVIVWEDKKSIQLSKAGIFYDKNLFITFKQ